MKTVMVRLGQATVIGETNIDTIAMISMVVNPRLIQVMPTGSQGTIDITFHELIGKPKELYIRKADWLYEVTDENIINGYKQVISGIVVVPAIVPGLN